MLISAAALARDGACLLAPYRPRPHDHAAFERQLSWTTIWRAEGEALLGSVGGYHFEGLGAQLFDNVEGDYFSVLGLPLLPVLAELREQGVLET